MNSQNSDRPEG